jgi:hypothetical protein
MHRHHTHHAHTAPTAATTCITTTTQLLLSRARHQCHRTHKYSHHNRNTSIIIFTSTSHTILLTSKSSRINGCLYHITCT